MEFRVVVAQVRVFVAVMLPVRLVSAGPSFNSNVVMGYAINLGRSLRPIRTEIGNWIRSWPSTAATPLELGLRTQSIVPWRPSTLSHVQEEEKKE